ncbi:MAG: hypothetical protein WCS98_05615 [Bacillota bacterium]|jgi:hypothetical protein|nr:hypothetical protein [Bacillota bacterium]MDD4707463.1 hypothetical protein [Bacillota bacterium]
MWILLALGFLIPFVYIGYLVSKLDRFLAENNIAIEDERRNPAAIVLGGTNLAAEVGELQESLGFRVFYMTEPFLFEREQNIHYLFALSENDADNITICKIGRKLYNIERMVSLCNDRKNEAMFISEKINYLSGDGITAQMVCEIAAKETEVIP